MSNLTDADEKSFVSKMIAGLDGNKAILIAGQSDVPGSGWDPTTRIAALKNGEQVLDGLARDVARLEVELKTAMDARRAAHDRNYQLASSSVSSVEGAIGKDHPFAIDLHQIRGGFSKEPAAAPPKP